MTPDRVRTLRADVGGFAGRPVDVRGTSANLEWADPLASLVIVYYGVKEGMHAWL